MSILVAILIFGLIIFVHEFGHFLAARACGVVVLEFSIGFGPRLWSRVIGKTRYSVKALPLGGACAMLGEDAAGSGDFQTANEQEELMENGQRSYDFDGVRLSEAERESGSFESKPAWQRWIISFAGVAFNFLLAFIMAMLLLGLIGRETAAVSDFTEGAPVAASGLQAGDELQALALGSGRMHRVRDFQDIYLFTSLHARELAQPEQTVRVRYLRDGQTDELSFQPYHNPADGRSYLGISFQLSMVPVKNPLELVRYSIYEVGRNIHATISGLRLLISGQGSRREVMGPAGTVATIGNIVSESGKHGLRTVFLTVLNLCLLLSANIAVMNLLPIPALDGGRLIFITAELLFRRRLNPELEARIHMGGMIFLLLLMGLTFVNDIWNMSTG